MDADVDKGLLRFRIQDEVNPGGAGEAEIVLTGIVLDASALNAKDTITVSTKAISLNPAIGDYDQIAATAVAKVEEQFEIDPANITGFDGVIDVESNKEVFINQYGNTSTYDYAYAGISNRDSFRNAVSVNQYVYEVIGEDLSHALAYDSDEDGKLSASETSNFAFAYSQYNSTDDSFKSAINADLNKVTYTQSSSGDLDSYVAHALRSSGVDSGVPTMEQEFSLNIIAQDTTAKKSYPLATGLSYGEWTLNGASVFVPYMPCSNTTALSQIIYVSNKGSQPGMISVTAFDEAGNSYGPYDLGNLEGNSVRKLTGDINTRLYADGFESGKVGFVVTVTAPSKHVEVYSAYKAGSDRGTVNNAKAQ